MEVSEAEFRKGCAQFASGVTVVSLLDSTGSAYGVTVSAFTSVSLAPLLLLVCLDKRLGGIDTFENEKPFGISILTENQEHISKHFATKGTDRTLHMTPGHMDVPVVESALAAFVCTVEDLLPGGDHILVLGRVKSVTLSDSWATQKPLLYFRRGYRKLVL